MADQTLRSELDELVSERRNAATTDIDLLPTLDILRKINDEDKRVAVAVEAVLPDIALGVDSIVEAFNKGARLVYVGAGTSGRLGVLDAAECPPTFRVPGTMVVGLIAGGPDALTRSVEGAEDDADSGRAALERISLTGDDVVVGLAASGRTPFVVGALAYARSLGGATIAVSCNPKSTIAQLADIAITPIVGEEVIAGSTRMKAGTAEKLVLNMLTTTSMIRIGKTYQNLMVDMNANNRKLAARATKMVMETTGCTLEEARETLDLTGNDVKLAILIGITGLGIEQARQTLSAAGGFLRQAIDSGRQTKQGA